MKDDVHRIEFDASLDEIADANLRWPRGWRASAPIADASWTSGGSLTAAVLLMILVRANEALVEVSAVVWATLAAIALALGADFGYQQQLQVVRHG